VHTTVLSQPQQVAGIVEWYTAVKHLPQLVADSIAGSSLLVELVVELHTLWFVHKDTVPLLSSAQHTAASWLDYSDNSVHQQYWVVLFVLLTHIASLQHRSDSLECTDIVAWPPLAVRNHSF